MRLVLEGGGVRAAYSAGVVRALDEAGVRFDAVVGSSSGAVNAAFFASRQTAALCELWANWVPGTHFISWRRQLTPWAGPGLGIDQMLDEVIMGRGLLDCEAATRGEPVLYLAATDVDSGEAVIARPDAHNLIDWMRASMAIPVGYNRLVSIGGQRFVDGGMAAPVAFDSELDIPLNGPAVVVLTRRLETAKRPPGWWEQLFIATIVPRPARRPSRNQFRLHNRVMQRLRDAVGAGDAILVDPPENMPLKRLTRDKASIVAGIEIGYEVGNALATRLKREFPGRTTAAPGDRSPRRAPALPVDDRGAC